MKIWTIAYSNVKRMMRERSNIFFVFVFPIALILVLGIQFGGGVDPKLAIHQADDGQLASAILEELTAEDHLEVLVYETSEEAKRAVDRGTAQGGVLIPAGMDDDAATGEPIEISYVARPDSFGLEMQSVVAAAVSKVMTPVSAAQFATEAVEADFLDSLQVAREGTDAAPGVKVETSAVGESFFPEDFGRFDLGAPQQLVLFVFLTAMTGAAALIMSRQLGVTQRMLSTPTSVGTIVTGEGAGRWATAMVQGLYIMIATLILFQVNWGNLFGSILVLVAFAATGAGAGLLMGAVFRNENQAVGVGIMLSIGLAALGGSMMPSEFFSDTLRTISHITPHAWALDAYAELIRRDGTVADISTELGVLVGYAVLLFTIAAWRLRKVITRP